MDLLPERGYMEGLLSLGSISPGWSPTQTPSLGLKLLFFYYLASLFVTIAILISSGRGLSCDKASAIFPTRPGLDVPMLLVLDLQKNLNIANIWNIPAYCIISLLSE